MEPQVVLLVDDEPDILVTLFDLLSREGYRVATAGDPRGGLRMADELRPSVAIVDFAMPHMDGLEFLRDLARVSPTTRAIILSAFADDPLAAIAAERGAVDVLKKPAPSRQILDAVRRALPEAARHP